MQSLHMALSGGVRYFHLSVESPSILQVKMQINRSVLLVSQHTWDTVAIEVVLNIQKAPKQTAKKKSIIYQLTQWF